MWSNVFMVAGLQPGETLLVHGGASGIGTMAIQLATRARREGAGHRGRAGEAGASAATSAPTSRSTTASRTSSRSVREATDGHGADVILDIMGAKYLDRNVDALAADGRLVVIGMQGGTKGELDLGTLLRKRGAIIATALRARPLEEKAAIVRRGTEHVWPLIADGHLRPVVDQVVPMTGGGGAPRARPRRTVGKVLLAVRDE